MSISVVIPVYNRPISLKRAVASVIAQTLPPLEIIVVDDGSDIPIPEHPDYQLVRHDTNHGPAFARNSGIQISQGDYIAFLDSDDAWAPEKLARQMALLQKEDALYIHTDEAWFRDGQTVRPKKRHRKQGGFFLERSLELCLISPSAVMMHRDFWGRIGLWNEKLRIGEDYELWIRAQLTLPVAYVDEPLTIKYSGIDEEPQLSSSVFNIDLYRIYALLFILRREKLSLDKRFLIEETLLKKLKVVEAGFNKYGRQFPTGLKAQIESCLYLAAPK